MSIRASSTRIRSAIVEVMSCTPVQHEELIRCYRLPGADDSVRPLHAHLHLRRRTQAEVSPAQLATGVAAADRQLAAQGCLADLHLDPGADRIAVASGLLQANAEPVSLPGCT